MGYSIAYQPPCEARAKRYFIQQAIPGLPERDRLVLVLRDVLSFTNEEVAEFMALLVSTVKAGLVRDQNRVAEASLPRHPVWKARRDGAVPV